MGGHFVSYAPNCEDVPLWRTLADIAAGYYIDFGPEAADGPSVTRAFYDRGWQGISIRADAEEAAALAAIRPRDTVIQAGPLPRVTLAAVQFVRIKGRDRQAALLRELQLSVMAPWIVVIEAGCQDSDRLLKDAGYAQVLFDGLNDFHLSPAQAARAGLLRAPAHAGDHFVRAGAAWEGRIAALEAALQSAQASIEGRSQRLLDAVRALGQARRDIELLGQDAAWLRGLLTEARDMEAKLRAETAWLHARLADARASQLEALVARTDEVVWLRDCLSRTESRAAAAEAAAAAMLNRGLPAVLRRAGRRLRRVAARAHTQQPMPPASKPPGPSQPTAQPVPLLGPQHGAEPATSPAHAGPAAATPSPGPIRAVHQFHAGSSLGDAITNAMVTIRSLLRKAGFDSEIFVEDRGRGLAADIRLIDALPAANDAFLLVHHSMGFASFETIRALPVRKGLIYHNITPPELFAHRPVMAGLARLGQEQLALWRDQVAFALSVSDYNAADLHRLGFPSIRTCPLLCDVGALLARAAAPRLESGVFTVLFVGRVTRSKAQLDLVGCFAAFRAQFGRPCRLALVGALNPDEYAYLEAIEGAIASSGLAGAVQLTGLVSDDELHGWYRQADLYVSLSLHEGFCVPLVEAIAHGVPVLAWPAGAVAQTLGDAGDLLASREPDAVAAAMLTVAGRSPAEAHLARERGLASIQRFAPERALPILLEALADAGAVAPVQDDGP